MTATRAVLLCAALFALCAAAVCATPLDDFLALPDPNYKWELVNKIQGETLGATYVAYNLNLTSCAWLTPADTDKPIWQHWLQVIVPENVKLNTALIYIDGNGNSPNPPTDVDPITLTAALSTNQIAAHLMQIPNEPIYFTAEPGHVRRTEDAIIAYTWLHFIKDQSQPFWLLRMPMVKAAVRALDAVQEFVKTMPSLPPVNDFVVAGASKRGWVTWLVGAVDKRAKAIVPIVLDVLNMVPNINHQYQCYGNWSFALDDYQNLNLMSYLNTPAFQAMADIIDPYVYRQRLTMPKLLITATGDEFFLPDDEQFFWDDMLEPKYFRTVHNAEHSMFGHEDDLALTIATFVERMTLQQSLPTYNWTVTPNADKSKYTIVVETPDKPTAARLWHALNPKRRDFRLVTNDDPIVINPILWEAQDLQNTGSGALYRYEGVVDVPFEGWRGFNVELYYSYGFRIFGEHYLKFTTTTTVVPEVLPFPPCGNHC